MPIRTTPTTRRPIFLGINLSNEEHAALILLAEREGLPKSLYARRELRRIMRSAALPADLLAALNIQATNTAP